MTDRNYERVSPRASGGSGAPSFADFPSFREMISEEREAARVKREAAAAEQRRLMAEVYEFKTSASQRNKKSDCCCTERYCDWT